MTLDQLQKRLSEENLSLIADLHGEIYTSELKGIGPILNPMKENVDFFKDAIVCDKVIGKATAMLLVLSGVKFIFAYTMSKKAIDILNLYHIEHDYHNVVEYIINRDNTGMCPMEETVYDIDDLELGKELLIKKQIELMNKKRK